MQGCVHIGDEALYQLVRRCSRLQLVNLHGCRNLQDDGIMELAENSPALRYFNNVISENVDATLGNVNRVLFNPNGRGVDCSCTFSDGYFSVKIGVWRSQIFVTIPVSENHKNMVFNSVLGLSRRCGHNQPPT